MWMATRNEKYGVAVCNYNGLIKHGLRLLIGDVVVIKEQCSGWFRGCLLRNTSCQGIFPANYIYLKDFRSDSVCSDESLQPIEDPVVSEVTAVLKEWNVLWKQLYLRSQTMLFKMLHVISLELIDCRRLLMSRTLTLDQTRELKQKITTKIDWGNKMLNLDLVPRVNSEEVDASKTNPLELFEIHQQSGKQAYSPSVTLVYQEVTPVAGQMSVYQLMLMLHDYNGPSNQEYEMHWRLYNGISMQCLSESFVTYSSRMTRENIGDRVQGTSAIFTDLCESDFQTELYLVAHVYRISGLKDGEVNKTPVALYRRPLGCAIQRVDQVFGDDNEETQFQVKFVPCSESEFAQFHESLLRKQAAAASRSVGVSTIVLTALLRVFKGSLEKLQEFDPRQAKNSVITSRMGFPDIIMPDLLRNDLFVTLMKADLEKSSKSTSKAVEMRLKSTPKNVELRLIVLNKDGKELSNCISTGSSQPHLKEYNSAVLYHNNAPRWNEIVRLEIPIDCFHELHLRLELRHCSRSDRTEKKLFGFAFIPLLTANSTALNDGIHELSVFKCDDNRKLRATPPFYLSYQPYCSQSGTTDSISIETMLCSTKLTQNADLLNLLRWRTESSKLYQNLEKLMKLDGKEIMKFLPDILDALFGMMSTENTEQTYLVPLAFKALVHILSLLDDGKYVHFWNVVDNYIENNFSAVLAHRLLLDCLSSTFEDLMSTTEAPSTQDGFLKTFGVLDSVGKFIVQSRRLHNQTNHFRNSGNFSTQIHDIFVTISKVLALDNAVVRPAQIVIIKRLPSFWSHLSQVLPYTEIFELIISLITAIPKNAPSEINRAKLWCLKAVAKSRLLTDVPADARDGRIKLFQLYVSQLKRHLIIKSELKRCSKILSILLLLLSNDQQMSQSCQTVVQIVVDGLLDVLARTVLTAKSSPIIGNLVVCTMAMLKLMDEHHYLRLIHPIKDRKPLCDFLLQILNMFYSLAESSVFPKEWIFMQLSLSQILFSTTQLVSQTITDKFLTGTDFNQTLWFAYFNVLVKFITQPCLQLERFSVNKRAKIVKQFGDMRLQAAGDLVSSWQRLGESKGQFMPSFVGLFLDVTVVPLIELRKLALPIFYDFMVCERNKTGNFSQLETEVVDRLDILISEGKGDYEYQKLFTSILHEKLETVKEWKKSGIDFVQSISTLIARLLDYRQVTTTDDSYEKRMICTMQLLDFYKTSRTAMYVRYIYKLYNLHKAYGNHTEAGLTLKLHAELLEWSDELLPVALSDTKLRQQLKWQAKESIYLLIIDEFDKGKSWEYGLSFCEELATVYKSKFMYEKLSFILKTQSEFYDRILNELRGPPEYFRIGLFGQKFPSFLRNKEFIYRGSAYEKLESFQSRFMSEFSDAISLTTIKPPGDDIKMADAQYLQMCHVVPVADIDPRLTADGIPRSVSAFYEANDVSKFRLDRPLSLGKGDNDVKNLQVERTVLEISGKLPGLLRWSPIVSQRVTVLNPLAVAIDTMHMKNAQLVREIEIYASIKANTSNINPLTMQLNGVIDAAVQGGTAKYQEAFLTDEFLLLNPDKSTDVAQLKDLIKQQVNILRTGLDVHKRLVPDQLVRLHQHMEEMFSKMITSFKLQIPLLRASTCSTDETSDSSQGSSRNSVNTAPEVTEMLTPTPTTTSNMTSSRFSSLESGSIFSKLLDGRRRTPTSHSSSHWYANDDAAAVDENRTVSSVSFSQLNATPQTLTIGRRKNSAPQITSITPTPTSTRQHTPVVVSSSATVSHSSVSSEKLVVADSSTLRQSTVSESAVISVTMMTHSSSSPSLPPRRSQSAKDVDQPKKFVPERRPLPSVPDEDDLSKNCAKFVSNGGVDRSLNVEGTPISANNTEQVSRINDIMTHGTSEKAESVASRPMDDNLRMKVPKANTNSAIILQRCKTILPSDDMNDVPDVPDDDAETSVPVGDPSGVQRPVDHERDELNSKSPAPVPLKRSIIVASDSGVEKSSRPANAAGTKDPESDLKPVEPPATKPRQQFAMSPNRGLSRNTATPVSDRLQNETSMSPSPSAVSRSLVPAPVTARKRVTVSPVFLQQDNQKPAVGPRPVISGRIAAWPPVQPPSDSHK